MLLRVRLPARSAALLSPRQHLPIAGALIACLMLVGCGEDPPDGPRPDTTTKKRGRGAIAATPVAEEQKTASVESRFASKKPPPPDPRAKRKANEEPEAAEAAAAEEKPRDYPAELLTAARGAETCVQPRVASAALPAEVLVSLEALVLETGTIVTGTARAAVLTPEELECVKRRLESTRLPDKVKDAPRRVSATLKLTFKPQQLAAPAANAAPPAAPQAPAANAPSRY